MYPSSERQTEYVYVKLRTSGFLSGGEAYFNVSEERVASFFRVAEFGSRGRWNDWEEEMWWLRKKVGKDLGQS